MFYTKQKLNTTVPVSLLLVSFNVYSLDCSAWMIQTVCTLSTPGREASNRQLPGKLFQRVSAEPSYMRLMTQDMIITHEQITLLQRIGQGTHPRMYM